MTDAVRKDLDLREPRGMATKLRRVLERDGALLTGVRR